jgi:Uma2 family endonuclease
MEAIKLEKRKYSTDEYFQLLKGSREKLELINGVIRMMSGATRNHNDIAANTFVALRTAGSGCYITASDTAVGVAETGSYFFPDISATCEEPTFEDRGIAVLNNPNLIIEVLSLSTERKDKGVKFEAYTKLKSLKEYILIDSKALQVHAYYRLEQGSWEIGNYFNREQHVEVKTLGVSVPMATIYEGVEFEDENQS